MKFLNIIATILLLIVIVPIVLVYRTIRFFIVLIYRVIRACFGVPFQLPDFFKKVEKEAINTENLSPFNNININDLNGKDYDKLIKKLSDKDSFPKFEGEVKHAYELQFVNGLITCPRCRSKTMQYFSDFAYATQTKPNIAFVPAGFFCVECPTVIIDQELIRMSVGMNFQFRGVFGIYIKNKKLELFETWNGSKAVYIYDDGQNVVGLRTNSIELEFQSRTERKNLWKNMVTEKSNKKKNKKK